MLPLSRLSCTQSRGEEDEHEAPLKGDGEMWVQGGVGWGKEGVPKAEGMVEEQMEGAAFAFSRRAALGEPARALAGHPM